MQNCSAYSEMFVPEILRSRFCGRLFRIQYNNNDFQRRNCIETAELKSFLHVLKILDVRDHSRSYSLGSRSINQFLSKP